MNFKYVHNFTFPWYTGIQDFDLDDRVIYFSILCKLAFNNLYINLLNAILLSNAKSIWFELNNLIYKLLGDLLHVWSLRILKISKLYFVLDVLSDIHIESQISIHH